MADSGLNHPPFGPHRNQEGLYERGTRADAMGLSFGQ
jgi:hypothetical protein